MPLLGKKMIHLLEGKGDLWELRNVSLGCLEVRHNIYHLVLYLLAFSPLVASPNQPWGKLLRLWLICLFDCPGDCKMAWTRSSPSTGNEGIDLSKERRETGYSSAVKTLTKLLETSWVIACLWDTGSPLDCACFAFIVTKDISVMKPKEK